MEADIRLQTFIMTNTRPGNSRYREIIPAENNRDKPQVSIMYSSASSRTPPSSVAVINVASPKILFALDPAFALLSFFTSAFPSIQDVPSEDDSGRPPTMRREEQLPTNPQPPALSYRFDLLDASITVLQNEEEINSQAIRLSIEQISVSQQVRRDFGVFGDLMLTFIFRVS
jgi:vacuolar protein sorting-associated protein 13A/C